MFKNKKLLQSLKAPGFPEWDVFHRKEILRYKGIIESRFGVAKLFLKIALPSKYIIGQIFCLCLFLFRWYNKCFCDKCST